MTIGIQYWNEGASAPGAWTSCEVLQCHPRELYRSYDRATLLDQTEFNARVKKYRVTLAAGPMHFRGANRALFEALAAADYVRIKDTRCAFLGDANTIDFIHAGESEPARSAPTLLAEDLTLELISKGAY